MLRRVISSLLIFQMAIGLSVSAAADSNPTHFLTSDQPNAIDQELGIYSYATQRAAPGTPPPQVGDPLNMTKQFRRHYYADGTFVDTPLDRINTALEKIVINDPDNELSREYDAKNREVIIKYRQKVKGEKEKVVTDAHVFKNVDMTADFVSDGNIFYTVTAQGIRAMAWEQLYRGLFRASIPNPVIIPTFPGTVIQHLELITAKLTAQDILIRKNDGGKANRHQEFDLVAKIQSPTGVVASVRFAKEEVMDTFSMFQGFYLELLQVANPFIENQEEVEKIIGEFQIENENFRAHQLEALNAPATKAEQDVLMRAIANSGQLLEYRTTAKLLKRDVNGHNAYQQLASSPRRTYSADPSATGQWATSNRILESREAILQKYGLRKPWRKILDEAFKGQSEETLEANAIEEVRLSKSFLARMQKKAIELATSKAMQRTGILVAAVAAGAGVVAIDKHFGGPIAQWQAAGILTKLDHAANVVLTQTPYLKVITSDMYGSVKWITSYSRLAFVIVGTAVLLEMRPAAYYAAHIVAKAARRTWTGAMALFNYGNQVSVRANYPVQKVALDKAGKANLYSLFDNNEHPSDYPEVMQTLSPFATKAERAEAVTHENINAAIERRIRVKARARLIAASIVSKAADFDIATLILLGQGFTPERIATIFTNDLDMKRFTLAQLLATKELIAIGDQAYTAENSDDEIHANVLAYQSILAQFNHEKERLEATGTARLRVNLENALTAAARSTKYFLSHNVISFSLFGLRGYKQYIANRNGELDKHSGEMGAEIFDDDFPASIKYQTLVAAPDTAGIAMFNPSGGRLIGDGLAQVGIFAGTVGADVLRSAMDNQPGMVNGATPYTGDADAGMAREQTFREAMKAIYAEYISEGQIPFSKNQADIQMNQVHDFQLRFGLDYVTRMVGMSLKNGFSLPLLVQVGFMSGTLIFGKTAAIHSVSGSVLGYVLFWPPVMLALRFIKQTLARNLSAVQEAHYHIDDGLAYNDKDALIDGIGSLQDLYRQDGKTIPLIYNQSPADFSPELARDFQAYAKQNVPVPTTPNKNVRFTLNVGVGTVISTIFGNLTSELLYHTSTQVGDLAHMMFATLGLFTVSQVALRAAVPIEVRFQKALRDLRESRKLRAQGGPPVECAAELDELETPKK